MKRIGKVVAQPAATCAPASRIYFRYGFQGGFIRLAGREPNDTRRPNRILLKPELSVIAVSQSRKPNGEWDFRVGGGPSWSRRACRARARAICSTILMTRVRFACVAVIFTRKFVRVKRVCLSIFSVFTAPRTHP